MVRGWLISLITGVAYSNWYEWIDYNSNVNDTESRFGIVYSNFSTPYSFTGKPAFNAWKTMTLNVNGFSFNKEIVLQHEINSSIGNQNDYCVLFSNREKNLYIVWTIAANHSISLYLGNTNVTVSSQFGSESRMATDLNGYLSLVVGNSIQYIVPDVRTEYQEIVALTPRLPVDVYTVGGEGTVLVPVMNPTSSDITVTVSGVTKTIGPNEGSVFAQSLAVPANLAYERNYIDVYTSKGNFTMQTIIILDQKYELQVVRITNTSITWNVVMNINETISATIYVNVTRNGSSTSSTFDVNLNNANNAGVNKQSITVPTTIGNATDLIYYSMTMVSNSKTVWVVPLQYIGIPDMYTNASDWKLSKVSYLK